MRQRLFGLILSLVFLLTLAGAALAKDGQVLLLSMNDMESSILPTKGVVLEGGKKVKELVGGLPRAAWVIKSEKDRHPGRVLACTSGDDTMGPLFYFFHGEPAFGGLSLSGIDVSVVGNHEFDLGPEVLAEGLKYARYPYVCSNLRITSPPQLKGFFNDFIVLEAGGLKVGFFGLITPDLAQISSPGPGVFADPDLAGVARKMVAKLREQGCDVIVALTHIGVEADRKLASQVAGIHAILGGHSHTVMEKADIVTGPGGWRTIITQAGSQARYLGHLNLAVAGGRLDESATEWKLLFLGPDVPSDQEVMAFLEPLAKKLDVRLGEPIGRLLSDADLRRETVRGGEAAIGDFLADALRWRFKADLAFVNGGGIRGDRILPAGPFSFKDLYIIYPFTNDVWLTRLSGEELIKVLEVSASALLGPGDEYVPSQRTPTGGFLQVSGLKVVYDLKAKPTLIDDQGRVISWGSRVKEVKVLRDGQWQPLDRQASYLAAASSWVAGGGDKQVVFKQAESKKTATHPTDATAAYIKELKGEIDPRLDGRIKVID